MMDTFKVYAKEIGVKAIVGDSFMMIIACLFASFFKSLGKNNNVILLVFRFVGRWNSDNSRYLFLFII
jgi:hypothetical protein